MTKLRILRWEDYPGFLGPKCNHNCTYESMMSPDKEGSDAAGSEDEGRSSKPRKGVLEAEKAQETDSTLKRPKKNKKRITPAPWCLPGKTYFRPLTGRTIRGQICGTLLQQSENPNIIPSPCPGILPTMWWGKPGHWRRLM